MARTLVPKKAVETPQHVIAAPQQADTEKPIEGVTASVRHSKKKWIAEKVADLQSYQFTHGTEAAAKRAGISESRVKAILSKMHSEKSVPPHVFSMGKLTGK